MMNADTDPDGPKKNGKLLNRRMHWDTRLRQKNLRDRIQRLPFRCIRQRSRFHLACDVYVMRGIRFGEILAVFRERGQACHRKQQQHDRRSLQHGLKELASHQLAHSRTGTTSQMTPYPPIICARRGESNKRESSCFESL